MPQQGGLSRIIAVAVDTDGNPRDLLVSTAGHLIVDASGGGGGGGDGAILDGVSAAIKATVFDYTNSNPLAAQLVDSNGNPVSVGGGTQYSEDSAAVDAEQLMMAGVVRKDARGTMVSADGDRTELQVNASGDLRVDGSAVTQPISVVSLPLPAGAATEATLAGVKTGTDKIPASPSTDRTTAAGPFSTRLSDGAAFYKATTPSDTQPISAVSLPLPTGAAQEHVTAASPNAARLTDGAAFYKTNTDTQLPAALVSGRLDVNLGATIAVPVTDNAGSLTVDNAGTFAVQDSEKLADNAGFTDGTTKVQPLGFIFDEVAGTALTENDIGAARMDSKRAAIGVIEDATTRGQRAAVTAGNALKVDGSAVTQPVSIAASVKANIEPETAGGLTTYRLLSAATTNGNNIKASAGQVYGWYLYNANAAVRYVKLYNKATAPTVGTDTPLLTLPIPPGAAANMEFTNGIAFGTGIGIAITTGVADADTAAVAANEIVVNLLYK